QIGDPLIDIADDRIAPIEIARLACPEIRDPDVVGDLRRAALGVDTSDQRSARLGVQEAADDEQLELARRYPLDAGRGGQSFRWVHLTVVRRTHIACRAG